VGLEGGPAGGPDGASPVVTVPRELGDGNAELLGARIEAAIDGHGAVVIDMSGCEFVDSIALAMLVSTARTAGELGARLAIAGVGGQPRKLFDTTRVRHHAGMLLFDTVGEARRELGLPLRPA
jgi:anti-anti-sigma factor